MFEKSIKGSARNAYNLLDDIFKLIDINHDGTINKKEANKIIKYMNSILGTNYSSELITKMDKNEDGKIDINDFKNEFRVAFNLKKFEIE